MRERVLSLEDALRHVLKVESAPDELRQELMAAAKGGEVGCGSELIQARDRRHWMAMALATAATVLLAVFLGGAFWQRYWSDPGPHLAMHAYQEYTGAQNMAFKGRPMANCQCGEGCNCCAQWSQQALGFAAPLPASVSCACLQGGRSCKVDGRPAALYLLDEQRAVYVFEEPIRKQPSVPGKAIPLPGALQARLWNEGGRGYLMLEMQR